MAVNEGFLPVGVSGEKLDTALLDNSQGHEVHREMVVLADPENFDYRASITKNGFLQVAQGGMAIDAFGRSRTSNTGNRLDCDFIYDKQPDLFDEVTNNGTITHNSASRDLTLALTGAADGDSAYMRSHPVPYTPGNSQLIEMTAALDLAEIGGGHVEVFLRSNVTGSVTDETITQAAWSDLTSGVDWTDSHIFGIDFQSLKVGRIRFFMVADGAAIKVADITNDNKRDTGYWQMPSLPAYWRLYVDDKGGGALTYAECGFGDENNAVGFRYVFATATASATMRAICCTVKSEGGVSLSELPGFPRSASTLATVQSVESTTVMRPILSIRCKSTFQGFDNLGLAFCDHFSVFNNQDIRAAIVLGGTLTGASWVDVDTTYSMMEYDVSATAISGGRQLRTDFFSGGTGANNSEGDQISFSGKAPMWYRRDGETGIITLAAVNLGTTANVRGDLGWDEVR